MSAIRTDGHLLSEFVTVFSRFEGPERPAVWGVNRYSGKWNHHLGLVRDFQAPSEPFKYWQRQVARELPRAAELPAAVAEVQALLARLAEYRAMWQVD